MLFLSHSIYSIFLTANYKQGINFDLRKFTNEHDIFRRIDAYDHCNLETCSLLQNFFCQNGKNGLYYLIIHPIDTGQDSFLERLIRKLDGETLGDTVGEALGVAFPDTEGRPCFVHVSPQVRTRAFAI